MMMLQFQDVELSNVMMFLKLLDELLRVTSISDPQEDYQPKQQSSCLEQKVLANMSDGNISPTHSPGSDQSEDRCSQWLLALEHLLPGVLLHRSPMVSLHFFVLFVLLRQTKQVLFYCQKNTSPPGPEKESGKFSSAPGGMTKSQEG